MRQNAFLRAASLLLLSGLLCIPARRPVSAAVPELVQSQRTYRIGYIEGGPFLSFAETLKHTKAALAKRGWQEKIELPPDASFSAGGGDNRAALEKHGRELLNRKDIDLILAAGTDATQAMLAVNNGRIPIVGMSVSDPMLSGMVLSPEDSGVDNFTVYFEPDAYARLFRIFHMAVGFQRLGLVYSLSQNSKIYSNVEEAHKIARERGFEVVEYGRISVAETEEECMEGLRWLVDQGIDAFYIPSISCFDYTLNPESSRKLLAFLMEKKIPSFAREGTVGVRSGALLGLSTLDLSDEGEFLANMIISILQGAKPRSIPMMMTTPPSLSLNMYTAQEIGFYPSFDMLTACDVIFREITVSQKCPDPN
jgi:ABC-type uncharacterized transport system substrate-binding protein